MVACSDCGAELIASHAPSSAPPEVSPAAGPAKAVSARELAGAATVAHVVAVLAEGAMILSLSSADGRELAYWTAVGAAGGATILGMSAAGRGAAQSGGGKRGADGCLVAAGLVQLFVLALVGFAFVGIASLFSHGRVLTNP